MIETTPETDTAAAVLAAARADRAIADAAEARSACSTRWTGRPCIRWTRSWRPRPWPRVRMARRGCRSRVRVRRGWRSSRSPSSPRRWGCRRMRGSGTSATPSNSATACPGCGERVQYGGLRPWLARRIAEKTLLLTQDAAGFVDRHVAPTAHRIGPGPARPAGRRGDRPLHARRSRSAVASNTRTAGTSPSSPARCTPTTAPWPSTASSTSPTRSSWRSAIQTVAAQLKDLGSEESLDVRRSMAVGELARRELALEFSVVEEGAPRPSRNHHPRRSSSTSTSPEDALRHTGPPGSNSGNHLITPGQAEGLVRRRRRPGGRQTRPRPTAHHPSQPDERDATPTYAVAIPCHPPGADRRHHPALTPRPGPRRPGGATGMPRVAALSPSPGFEARR